MHEKILYRLTFGMTNASKRIHVIQITDLKYFFTTVVGKIKSKRAHEKSEEREKIMGTKK